MSCGISVTHVGGHPVEVREPRFGDGGIGAEVVFVATRPTFLTTGTGNLAALVYGNEGLS